MPITNYNIADIIKTPPYDFLRTNPHLQNKLLFLTYGGSHAYGTSTPESDIDIRGCALNSKSDLIGLSNFEQVVEPQTDTTIYSFQKLVNLLIDVNPNTIEMLGGKPEHYIICRPAAQQLIDNRKMFLSRKAFNSFGGYANDQLRRLQNAVARDTMSQPEKERHMLNSIKSAMLTFNEKYSAFDNGELNLYIDKALNEELETEIFMDADLHRYPLRDYKAMWSEMNEIVKAYGKLNHRNNKKDAKRLNKHAMHLIRLYLMALDIFEKEEIITYRERDIGLLMSIRNGKYMNPDGTYQSEFFEMVNAYEQKLEYAKANSNLPERPNYKQIEDFVMSVNEAVILDD